MTIQQLIEEYRLPNYFMLWFWFNVLIFFFYSSLYMLYTDGQVSIKYVESSYYFNQSRYITFENMTLDLYPNSKESIKLFNYSNDYTADSLGRIYSELLDKSHFIRNFLPILYLFIWPLFNIIYGFLLIIDGSIIRPKDLYTLILLNFRGVNYELSSKTITSST